MIRPEQVNVAPEDSSYHATTGKRQEFPSASKLDLRFAQTTALRLLLNTPLQRFSYPHRDSAA